MADASSFGVEINEFTTQPWWLEEDLERYAELPEAIDIGEQKLDEQRSSEQMAQVAEIRLTIDAVQLRVRPFGACETQPEPMVTATGFRRACTVKVFSIEVPDPLYRAKLPEMIRRHELQKAQPMSARTT